MFQRKKIMEQKKTSNKLKHKKLNKSFSLVITKNSISKDIHKKKIYQFIPKTSYSVQTSERKLYPNRENITSNNTNYLSQLYGFNFYRQNSQGSLCSIKKDNNDSHFSSINNKYPKLSMYLLSDVKTPKLVEYIHNRRNNHKYYNYSQNYNDRYDNNNHNSNHYKNSTQNSSNFPNKNKKFSERNINIKLKLEEYYDNSIIKTNKNHKKNSRINLNKDIYMNKKTKMNNRYDKNKCIIERKFYGEDKSNKPKITSPKINKYKEKEKYSENKTLSGDEENEFSNLIYNRTNINMKKELKNDYNKNSKNLNNNQKEKSLNLNENKLINYKWSAPKMLLNKSKTNNKIFNTSLEEITNNKNNNFNYKNITHDNKTSKNIRYNDIKLIFPSFFNKIDINNESSQESTNLVGNTFSNKITINNSNIGLRKEKFINSFLDGPEDIHSRFVELHRQRKLFYENMCSSGNNNELNINNNKNMAQISDFDKNEYSEYFDNFNEEVPII